MIVSRGADLELALFRGTVQGFPKHVHDEHVVSANLTGDETVWLDRRTFTAGTEGLTLYNPGQVQACSVRCDGRATWTWVSLYLAPGAFERLAGRPVEFDRPFAPCRSARDELARLALDPDLPEPLREEGLVALAGRLAQGDGPRAAAAPPLRRGDPRLARVAALLRASLAEPPSLATLAAEAGVTPEHLVRSFRAVTGLPPRAWQLQLRLAEARRRLRRGDAVVGVALDLGFADQAHFHRLFRKSSGMTPGAYRRVVARINR